MNKKTITTDIYGTYDPHYDITTIFEDKYDRETGEMISRSVKGWYHGEPNETDNKAFYGKLTCEYHS